MDFAIGDMFVRRMDVDISVAMVVLRMILKVPFSVFLSAVLFAGATDFAKGVFDLPLWAAITVAATVGISIFVFLTAGNWEKSLLREVRRVKGIPSGEALFLEKHWNDPKLRTIEFADICK